MKKYYFMTLSNLLIFGLISCGQGMKTTKNEFLGEIPSIDKYYSGKLDEKEKELKECTNMDKALKLDNESKAIKEEWVTKLKEYPKTNPLTTPIHSRV